MCRRLLFLIFTVLLVIALIGCGVKQFLPGKKVPPLEGYSTVVLLPFDFSKLPDKAEYVNLPTLVSYATGTKLKARYEDITWIYDQSQAVKPVSKKLEELNISGKDVFEDPLTAAKLAEAFQADLVIAGRLDEPRFTKDESGKIYEVKSESSSSKGGSRYYATHQTSILPSDIKVIEPKSNVVIWDGKITGYTKYESKYRTGSPQKFEREESMLADVRRDLVEKFVNKLYPK